jgi:hypothetical protein
LRSPFSPNQALIPFCEKSVSTEPKVIPPWVQQLPVTFWVCWETLCVLGCSEASELWIRFKKSLWRFENHLRSTMRDWAPTSWRRLKDKKVSFCSVRGSFMVTLTSPTVTSFPQGSEYHDRLRVP